MIFIFSNADGKRIKIAGITENAGYSYARKHELEIAEVINDSEPQPEPMTQSEIEETLLDQEYRLLLLEYGLEEEEPI